MRAQSNAISADRGKQISVLALFAVSIIIILSGACFSIYSVVTNASFIVFSTTVPGVVFGLVVAFLGVRYFLSVRKLKAEVYKKSSKFSWSNFKKQKSRKVLSKGR